MLLAQALHRLRNFDDFSLPVLVLVLALSITGHVLPPRQKVLLMVRTVSDGKSSIVVAVHVP